MVDLDCQPNQGFHDAHALSLDTSAAAPTVSFTDSGANTTDGITNSRVFSVAGLEAATASAGISGFDHLEYQLDGTAGTWLSVAAGTSSFTLGTATADGPHTVNVRQIDKAGNTSSHSTTALAYTLDTTAPAVTLAEQGTTKFGDAWLNAAEAAATTTIRVTLPTAGSLAAVGDSVELLLGGAAFGTAKKVTLNSTDVNTNGYVDFSVSQADLGSDGAKSLTAKITDVAGNFDTSPALAFTLDTTGPTALTVALTTNSGSTTDAITNDAAAVTVSGVDSGATAQYQVDGDVGGTVWSSSYVAPTADGVHTVVVRQFDAAGNTSGNSNLVFTLDTTPPTDTYLSYAYTSTGHIITLTGTNLDSLLSAGETSATDIKARLDWSKLSYDIDGDTAQGTIDIGFSLSDISSAYVISATKLDITLTTAKATALEAAPNFGNAGGSDRVDINIGFSRDLADNPSTTDNAANLLLDTLDLGTVSGIRLHLIKAATMGNGKIYFFLDRVPNGSADYNDEVNHNELDALFNNGTDTYDTQTTGSGAVAGTDDARTALISGYTLILPTKDELLALYNDPDVANPPAGWILDRYMWSATSSGPSGYHDGVKLADGSVATNIIDTNNGFGMPVAFQVL